MGWKYTSFWKPFRTGIFHWCLWTHFNGVNLNIWPIPKSAHIGNCLGPKSILKGEGGRVKGELGPPALPRRTHSERSASQAIRALWEIQFKYCNRLPFPPIRQYTAITMGNCPSQSNSYADGFKYLPDGSLCWMLLAEDVSTGWAHSYAKSKFFPQLFHFYRKI